MKQRDERRILELIDRMVDSNSTPEQVCGNCPELLPLVQERWQLLRRIEAEVEAIFPAGQRRRQVLRAPRTDEAFPIIPGYEIVQVLGHGGMGIVYKALHQELNRVVALKMLLSGTYSSERERKRFVREAKAIAGLRHPNLVQVYDIGEAGSCPYFTMEFIAGGSLAGKLGGAPQSPRFASQTTAALASAMQTAHQGGVVHRDLKPSNVLLCDDGSPKIADFGLARFVESGQDITRSDVRVGTPCYMSPEQISNRPGSVGPLADLYALGAILYEMLTGRPPFRGETAADTEHQILNDEPIAPSRLNSKAPRDLETICLKCLQKDPTRRYPTCAALADDLRRYENGEPVLARPVGRIAKTVKWIRRRPAHAMLIAGGVAVCVGLIGGAFYYMSANIQRSSMVDHDLSQATALEEDGSWMQARAVLIRARVELGNHGPQSLRDRLKARERDLELVARLDQLHMHYPVSKRGALNFDHATQDFVDVFHDAGLGNLDDDPALLAQRIGRSPIRKALLEALYLELVMNPRPRELEIARKVDADPAGWRGRALDPAAWNEAAVLKKLLESSKIDVQPATLLLAIGMRYAVLDGDAAPFFRKLQAQYPNDFWINLKLGEICLEQNRVTDAIRYLQAAVSVRPDAAIAEDNLAVALGRNGKLDEAIAHYRTAVRLDPATPVDHCNLGLFLDESGNHKEAIEESKRAIALEPNNDWFHTVLGGCYRASGRKAEAQVEYERAISLKPQSEAAFSGLNACLQEPLSAEQRRTRWETLLDSNPSEYQAWDGYAEFCLFLGRPDKYAKARTALLKQFGNTVDPRTAELAGRACLLLPGSQEETQKAVALIDRALSADGWTVAPDLRHYFNVAKALADYRQGKYESAVNRMQGPNAKVLVPIPQLVLAMAYYRLGDATRAQKCLNQAVASFNWSKAKAIDGTAWVSHALRREAEELLAEKSEGATGK